MLNRNLYSYEKAQFYVLWDILHRNVFLTNVLCISGSIKELIQQYSLEARAGQYEFSRALADFSSADENALNFRRGDIIAVVPREDAYTKRGWLYGIKVRGLEDSRRFNGGCPCCKV